MRGEEGGGNAGGVGKGRRSTVFVSDEPDERQPERRAKTALDLTLPLWANAVVRAILDIVAEPQIM
eukprot:1544212-Rhodomonas_salina.3